MSGGNSGDIINILTGIGHTIGDLLDLALTWLTGGSTGPVAHALSDLLAILKYAAVLAFLFLWGRYSLVVLGAAKEKEGRFAKREYDKLRENLARGGTPARVYQERLTSFLDWIERFFGDAGMADRTLLPHFFWLKKPAPLWTAPAFDRCLLLALIYPIAAIFLIWAISGHVGPAESAFGLRPDLPCWRRGLAAAATGFLIFAVWRSALTSGWKCLVWWISAYAGAVAFAGAGVASLSKTAIKHDRQGIFLALFLPAMIVACVVVADLLASLKTWDLAGPVLLFAGLITLLNAPFDWASLGLTRALLRRGLELGGWVPFGLALVDAVLATGIIAFLTLAMVVGVQAFDELAVHGRGKPILPLDVLFDGIGKNPAAPEYWWVYALLLSSMIPSLVNLTIGGTSLLRGIPGVSAWFLSKMPPGGGDDAMHPYYRGWIGLFLTFQIFFGVFLGFAVQAVLAWYVIVYLMPAIGLDLLDMAHAVAAADLPARVGELFAGTR